VRLSPGNTSYGANDDGASHCSGATGNYLTNAYYGMNVTNCHCDPNGCLDQAVRTEANLAKADGVEIFVIRYCTGGCTDVSDGTLMQYVASSKQGTNDHYFVAPTSADINTMFQQIGRQLGSCLL